MDSSKGTAKELAAKMKEKGILVHAAGPRTVRMCTHLDVNRKQVERVTEELRVALRT
jgi:acetylornithine/succinyldiaminopimelate/putrescine aminotransferase